MKTEETIKGSGVAVVTKTALEELNELLEEIAKEQMKPAEKFYENHPELRSAYFPRPVPEYTAVLSDGARVSFKTFSELLNFPNRPSRSLVRVSAELRTGIEAERYNIDSVERFSVERFQMRVEIGGTVDPLVITIDGEERDALHAKERCQSFLERVTPGYAWMHRVPLHTLMPLTSIAAIMSGMRLFIYRDDARSPYDIYLEWALFVFGGAFVGTLLLEFLNNRFWPRVVFEIGQGIERSESRKLQRRWIVASLLLAIPVGLLVRFIGSRLSI